MNVKMHMTNEITTSEYSLFALELRFAQINYQIENSLLKLNDKYRLITNLWFSLFIINFEIARNQIMCIVYIIKMRIVLAPNFIVQRK